MREQDRFEIEVEQTSDRLKRLGKEIELNLIAHRLLEGIDLSDLSYHSLNQYDGQPVHITLALESDKKDSRLPHKIAQRFHLKFEKKKDWSGESLEMHADMPADRILRPGIPPIHWEISGVVPKTCKMILREIPLTEEEIEKARAEALANVKTVRIEREISCK